MSKSRRVKLIEEIENELYIIEQVLIDTPAAMNEEEYLERIEKVKKLRITLDFLKVL